MLGFAGQDGPQRVGHDRHRSGAHPAVWLGCDRGGHDEIAVAVALRLHAVARERLVEGHFPCGMAVEVVEVLASPATRSRQLHRTDARQGGTTSLPRGGVIDVEPEGARRWEQADVRLRIAAPPARDLSDVIAEVAQAVGHDAGLGDGVLAPVPWPAARRSAGAGAVLAHPPQRADPPASLGIGDRGRREVERADVGDSEGGHVVHVPVGCAAAVGSEAEVVVGCCLRLLGLRHARPERVRGGHRRGRSRRGRSRRGRGRRSRRRSRAVPGPTLRRWQGHDLVDLRVTVVVR